MKSDIITLLHLSVQSSDIITLLHLSIQNITGR